MRDHLVGVALGLFFLKCVEPLHELDYTLSQINYTNWVMIDNKMFESWVYLRHLWLYFELFRIVFFDPNNA